MPELNIFTSILLLIGGFALLCKGADVLVDGAVAIAHNLGISPLIIGLTVVSIGTSSPELAAAVAAALQGNGSIAIGNVFGSNIANLALIGGVCAIIMPITVNVRILKVELPIMFASMLLLLPMLVSGSISRFEGAILLGIFFCLFVLLMSSARKGKIQDVVSEVTSPIGKKIKKMSPLKSYLFVVLGIFGLTAGAKAAIIGAMNVGARAGLDDAVIGLTLVAIGTSLPELITCLAASFKRQDDISVGNLVGSNIFNTLLVIGASAAVKPLNVPKVLITRDFSVMAGITAVFIALALWKKTIRRSGGIALLLIYVAYLVALNFRI